MRTASPEEVTLLLRAWHEGDDQALGRVTPLVYHELYRAAQRYMAHEKPGHLLQNTALLNEVYVRLARLRGIDWEDRGHFYAVCARLMRRILTDYARSCHYQKRGGMAPHTVFDENLPPARDPRVDLIALDEALSGLAALDERASRVVELRFFGGLGVEETAKALKISDTTVRHDWKLAKAWLLRELSRAQSNGE
jgi:RNA polymerase sigma factor (TIGR02999 family)